MNFFRLKNCFIIITLIFFNFFGCSYNKEVLIDTSPPNSKVYIDGIEKGQTPYKHKFSFKNKSEYEILLQKEGFKDAKTVITDQTKNKSFYKINLEKILKIIHIESYPSNSNVILNGNYIGQTPLTEKINFKNINEILNLKIQKAGYYDGNIKIAYSTNKNDYFIQLLAIPKIINYKKIDNSKYLPIYDINNVPISVWILKEGIFNSGFIVAGHAEKAVCKIASVEVMTKLNQLGFNNDNLISFGIGYDIRSRLTDKWTQSYHEKISELEKNLTELSIKHPNQVKINQISYNQYYNTFKLIEKHIKNASKSQYQNLIVEYKYNNSPIIIPFHYINSQKIVSFKVKKSLFGKIPRGLALNSMENIIKEAQKEINSIISHNKKEKKKLKHMYSKYTTYRVWSSINSSWYALYQYNLPSLPSAPTGFVLQTTDQFGFTTQRDITAEEAVSYIHAAKDTRTKNILNNWVDQINSLKSEYREKILSEINSTKENLQKEKSEILKYINKIKKIKNDDPILIDAFLRGWPFSTNSTKLNKKLDKWYNKRKKLWAQILKNSININKNRIGELCSSDGDKIGGIFHNDDVFFKVISEKKYFRIIPYKVIGGDFIQVINKKVGITQYYSPFNFR